MTREEKISILDEALEKAYKEIANTESPCMGTEDFKNLLNAIDQMQFIKDVQLREDHDLPSPKQDFVPDEVQSKAHKEQIVSDEVQPEPEKPGPVDNDEDEDPEEPKFKMEEVRAALAKARAQGVNVAEIIRSFGVDNFQQISPTQYGAVMAKLDEG